MATLTTASPRGRYYPDGGNRRIKFVAADDGDPIPSNKAFVVDVDGTLRCRLRKETAIDDFPVLAGVIYPLDLAELDITNSTGPTTVWVIQNV